MATRFCRYIKTNGERCASPSLCTGAFCYFHTESEKRHKRMRPRPEAVQTILHPMTLHDASRPGSQRNPIPAEPSPLAFELPPLEDRHSIQLALSLLIAAVARNEVDPRRAALLFYGLQIASTNAHKLNPEPKRRPAKVSLTMLDEATGELIAPDEDPEDPDEYGDHERMGSVTRYLMKIEKEEAERHRLKLEAIAQAAAALPPNHPLAVP
ncbi:MAG: hypothetical protein WB439_17025 [Acidobacteriaceae bacterium]